MAGLPRKLSDEQQQACRHDYETTPAFLQHLADKYGIDIGMLTKYAKQQHWERYVPPVDIAQLDKDIELACANAEDEVMLKVLKAHMHEYWADQQKQAKPPKVPEQRRLPGIPNPSRNPNGRAGKAAKKQVPKLSTGSATKKAKPGVVVQFPGTVWTPPPPVAPPIDIFQLKTRTETVQLRTELSAMRGAISLRQLKQMQDTATVIGDYEHYFRVYLKPQDFLEQGEMPDEIYQERLTQLRKAALAYIAPTEGDTLSGAIKTLVNARSTLVQLERLCAGIANNGLRKRQQQDNEYDDQGQWTGPALMELKDMDVDQLRNVKGAMEMLLGKKARGTEPPRPPEPESLDDLRASPDDLPEPDLA